MCNVIPPLVVDPGSVRNIPASWHFKNFSWVPTWKCRKWLWVPLFTAVKTRLIQTVQQNVFKLSSEASSEDRGTSENTIDWTRSEVCFKKISFCCSWPFDICLVVDLAETGIVTFFELFLRTIDHLIYLFSNFLFGRVGTLPVKMDNIILDHPETW